MYDVFFPSLLFTKALSIYFHAGRKICYVQKAFYKIEALESSSYTLKSNNQQTATERERYSFCAEIKFYVMRRANTVGTVRGTCRRAESRCKRGPSARRDVTGGCRSASESIFFIKKQGRSIYIDDDDREIIREENL